jgi:hypothetical protein
MRGFAASAVVVIALLAAPAAHAAQRYAVGESISAPSGVQGIDIGAFEFVPPLFEARGGVRSISIHPKRFRARRSGGPVGGGILRSRPPVGARVTYTMSGDAAVEFSVGRRANGSFVPVKGAFVQQGVLGKNRFVFRGRIGGRTLRPGNYALTALAGHLVSTRFTIVR